jgi:hypothetical protein
LVEGTSTKLNAVLNNIDKSVSRMSESALSQIDKIQKCDVWKHKYFKYEVVSLRKEMIQKY